MEIVRGKRNAVEPRLRGCERRLRRSVQIRRERSGEVEEPLERTAKSMDETIERDCADGDSCANVEPRPDGEANQPVTKIG